MDSLPPKIGNAVNGKIDGILFSIFDRDFDLNYL
jgi:hypothetical protein